MRKKLLSVILAVSMILSCSISSFAQGNTEKSDSKINRETVITKDNLNKILKLYGIDPSTVKDSNTPKEQGATTVGQLEDALKLIEQSSKDITINETATPGQSIGISPMSVETPGTVPLSRTFSFDEYDLKHTCTASYIRETGSGTTTRYFTGANNAAVVLFDKSAPGSKRQIDSITTIGATFNSNQVVVSSDIQVGWYLVVGIPGTPFSYEIFKASQRVTSNSYFGTEWIP